MRRDERGLTVLVLGVAGNVSQGILKALSHSTLRCRVLGADISPCGMGLFTVDKSFVSPAAVDESFADWLLTICREENVDAVLCGVEPVLDAMCGLKETLRSQGTVCLVSDSKALSIGGDKFKTCQWLASQGFAAPRCALSSDASAIEALVEQSSFPLVAKPRFGKGSSGVVFVADRSELAVIRARRDYVIQEYLGSPDEEYTAGAFVDAAGLVRGAIVMRRDLQSGTTYRAELGLFPEIRAVTIAIARALQPMGPCNVQLRMTDRGPVCFEINVRFSGSTPMRDHFGYREVEAAMRHFVLGEAIDDFPVVTEGVGLRYWNELYVSTDAVHELRETGQLRDPRAFPVSVERYGIRD